MEQRHEVMESESVAGVGEKLIDSRVIRKWNHQNLVTDFYFWPRRNNRDPIYYPT